MPSKDKIQISKADDTARRIRLKYLDSIRSISNAAKDIVVKEGKPFSISDYPKFESVVKESLDKLTANSVSVINQATKEQWIEAYEKNISISEKYLNRKLLTETQQKAYFSRNMGAYDAFQKRKTDGLNLSDRVWKYNHQYKGELEMALDLSLLRGTSAEKISKQIRSYLNEPEKLFRKVRDKHGNLHLSKKAQEYSPGNGVYRSSYKNAMRVARTEVNMAYRASDYEKYNDFDFVIGMEIKRSNNLYGCKVCEELKGEYPKSFKFVGWHPQCRCYTVPVFNTIDSFMKQQEAILNGEDYKKSAQYKTVPKKFQNWYNENKNKIDSAKNKPYFIKDNEALIKTIKPNPAIAKPAKPKKVIEVVPEYVPKYNSLSEIKDAIPSKRKADEMYRERSGELWRSFSDEERRVLHRFTTTSGCSEYNSDHLYVGKTSPDIDIMTNALNKSSFDFTTVTLRGQCEYGFKDLLGIDGNQLDRMRMSRDYSELVGKKGSFKGFTSAGAGEGAGFTKDYMIYIEAPPKTRAMYAEPYSAFGQGDQLKWDGISKQVNIGGEQEMTFQRGTKVEIIEIKQERFGKVEVFARVIN